jgi:signal transduction histidine kinase
VIAAVTTLLISVIVASRYFFLAELHEDALRTAKSSLTHQSTAIAEQVDGSFKAVDLVLSSVGDYIARKGVTDSESYDRLMSDRETNRLLAEKITGLPFVGALVLIDASGRLINFSRGWPVPLIDVTDRDYFQALKGDPTLESFISKPVQNRVNGAWDICLARRLNGPNGEFLGVMVGAIRTQFFNNFFRSTLPGDGTTVSLLRSDGMLLATGPDGQELGTFPLFEQIASDGQSSLTVAHLLPNYPLLILATRTTESALQGWRSMAAQMEAMTGAIVVILLIAAGVIAHWRTQQAKFVRAGIERAEIEADRTKVDAERAKAVREVEMRAAHEMRLAAERTKLRKVNNELTASNNRAEAAIAKLKEAEEELQRKATALEEQAEELKRSNAELEQFAYVASHDLQEPLRTVSSYCQLLKRRYGEKLGEDAMEFIDFAVDGASRMQQLIKDLLAFSRVGRAGGEFEPLDMNKVVDTALANLSGAISDGGARIERGALPPVIGQRVQLAQMFQNLIGNAIKFRREGEPPVIRIDAAPSDTGLAQFTIEDNGIGIPEEHIERAFVIFQRLHEREKYSGTGIGLAIVKKTVELHGGRIWIESTVGQGSRFHFTLPVAKELANPALQAAE